MTVTYVATLRTKDLIICPQNFYRMPKALCYHCTFSDLSVSMYNSKYTVFSGETVTLGCKIDGSPSAIVVYWTKTRGNVNEKILTNNTKYSGSAVNTPSLTIYDVDQGDDGIYICYAISTVGSFNSSKMFLDVIPCKFYIFY